MDSASNSRLGTLPSTVEDDLETKKGMICKAEVYWLKILFDKKSGYGILRMGTNAISRLPCLKNRQRFD